MFWKQSTALNLLVGPVLDADGAPYTGITTRTQFRIFRNGTSSALSVSDTVTHQFYGQYLLGLASADFYATGSLIVVLNESGYVMQPVRLTVLPANSYDSIVDGTDYLYADSLQFSSSSTAADNAETALTGGSYNVGGGAVVAANLTDKTGMSLSAAGVQAIWDALTSALTTVGSIGKYIVDYLLNTYTRIGIPNGTDIAADIAAVQAKADSTYTSAVAAETMSTSVEGRVPSALVGGRMSSDVGSVVSSTTAAAAFKAMIDGAPTCTISSVTSTVKFITDLPSEEDDFYNGAYFLFTSGDLQGQSRLVSDYSGATHEITVDSAYSALPGVGDTGMVLGRGA